MEYYIHVQLFDPIHEIESSTSRKNNNFNNNNANKDDNNNNSDIATDTEHMTAKYQRQQQRNSYIVYAHIHCS